MAEIISFRGYTYNPEKVAIASALAPPYDVVTQGERNAFCEGNPYNVLRLELPSPPLEEARARFLEWVRQGVLKRDTKECLYPYEIEFEHMGRRFVRTGLICLVKVEPWERRVVIPHEKTFKKVTQERLELLKTVRAQFSQIFFLSKGLKELTKQLVHQERQPIFNVNDHMGNVHRLFRIVDKDLIDSIRALLWERPLYIADGHHRYTTAMTFMEECDRLGLFNGIEPPPHKYVMAYIVDTTDPGLICLPTHRVVKLDGGITLKKVKERLSRYFDISLEVEDLKALNRLDDILKEYNLTPSFFVIFPASKKAILLTLSARGRALLKAKGIKPPLSDLDVISVDEVAIKETFGATASELKEHGALRYEPTGPGLMDGLLANEIIFYLRPTPVDAMLEVADAGLTMPHKATYFYPKILTGTVIREL